jgi:integrase
MGRRRTRGEGSIFQRSDGLWVGRVDLGLVGNKRVRRQVTAHTLKELRPKFAELKAQIEVGVVTSNDPLSAWLDYWLDNIIDRDLKPRTAIGYRGYVETWIRPNLGARKLKDIKQEHVRALHDVMRKAGKSDTTIRQAHMILRRALNDALQERKIAYNPAATVKAPKALKAGHGVLSRDEARALLDLLWTYGEDGLWWVTSRYLVALLLGLRQGEALGLRWEDVDLTPGMEELRLERTIQRRPKVGLVVAPLKTMESVGEGRTLPLLPEVAHALARHRETAPDGYVWGGENPTDPRRDWGVWKGLLWSANCEDHPLHAARATTASILGEANVPLKTIAEILGHSQITTAWAFYVKSDDRQKREGLEAGWKMITAET